MTANNSIVIINKTIYLFQYMNILKDGHMEVRPRQGKPDAASFYGLDGPLASLGEAGPSFSGARPPAA